MISWCLIRTNWLFSLLTTTLSLTLITAIIIMDSLEFVLNGTYSHLNNKSNFYTWVYYLHVLQFTIWVILLIEIKPTQNLMFIKCGYRLPGDFCLVLISRDEDIFICRLRFMFAMFPWRPAPFTDRVPPPWPQLWLRLVVKSVTGEFWMIIGSLRCLSICEQDVYGWVKRERGRRSGRLEVMNKLQHRDFTLYIDCCE